MKKKILLTAASLCFLCCGLLLFANNVIIDWVDTGTGNGPGKNGCVNKPGSNDGHCATDGTYYLCENDGRKDCVKGQYP